MPSSTYITNLRDVVMDLVTDLAHPEAVWLFGSRAQQTGSKRSDVDLLLIDPQAVLRPADLLAWRAENRDRAPLDLFVSRDGLTADSLVNGSSLRDANDLPALLGATLLWTRQDGLVDDPKLPWRQEFRRDVDYKMTVVPTDFTTTLGQLPEELERMGLPNTLMGTDWVQVAQHCAEVLARSVDATSKLLTRAKQLNRRSAYPDDEYDVQNLFFLALRPWLPDVQFSPLQIRYAGRDKFADLACAHSRLIIEAKFVSDSSSAASVVKQLHGLRDFYEQAPTTQAIVFAIVVTAGVEWDEAVIDHQHTKLNQRPVVVTRSIRLPAAPDGR